uniref:Uncharacterized protein n=1 Tax=Tanacetum cinerariifolium TaxID=118510 RepID=A0A6L2L9R9_TANCI|nr:hypothetical protein [Tanacetum cinerariifolium]
MRGIQDNNQFPLSPMVVLFRPQRMGIEADYILKFYTTQQSDGSLDFHAYLYRIASLSENKSSSTGKHRNKQKI